MVIFAWKIETHTQTHIHILNVSLRMWSIGYATCSNLIQNYHPTFSPHLCQPISFAWNMHASLDCATFHVLRLKPLNLFDLCDLGAADFWHSSIDETMYFVWLICSCIECRRSQFTAFGNDIRKKKKIGGKQKLGASSLSISLSPCEWPFKLSLLFDAARSSTAHRATHSIFTHSNHSCLLAVIRFVYCPLFRL